MRINHPVTAIEQELAEGTQIGAGEFYQIFSNQNGTLMQIQICI